STRSTVSFHIVPSAPTISVIGGTFDSNNHLVSSPGNTATSGGAKLANSSVTLKVTGPDGQTHDPILLPATGDTIWSYTPDPLTFPAGAYSFIAYETLGGLSGENLA